jgi:hypothetical protein
MKATVRYRSSQDAALAVTDDAYPLNCLNSSGIGRGWLAWALGRSTANEGTAICP